MRRTTVGFAVVALIVCGGLVTPAQAGSASRCTVALHVNLMPQVAFSRTVPGSGMVARLPVVECRGRPAGPWAGPDAAELIPEFDIDADVAT